MRVELLFSPFLLSSQELSDTKVYEPYIRTRTSKGITSEGAQAIQWFRGGLVCQAHTRLYHATLAVRVIKKKKRRKGWQEGGGGEGGASNDIPNPRTRNSNGITSEGAQALADVGPENSSLGCVLAQEASRSPLLVCEI